MTTSPNTSRCIASHEAAEQYAPSTERSGRPPLPHLHILFLNAITYCLFQKDVTILPVPLLNLRRYDPEPPWLPFGRTQSPQGPWGLVPRWPRWPRQACALVPLCLPASWKQCLGGPCPPPIGLPTRAKANIITGEEVFWLCRNSSQRKPC